MRNETLRFEPVRRAVYTAGELYAGFEPADPASWTETRDFRIYAEFVHHGGSMIADDYIAVLRALHDTSMTQLTAQVIERERVVAVMGGHRAPRGDDDYRAVATLARELTRRGYLVTTGGGPGAMEAAHLGARLAGDGEDRLDEAIGTLARVPRMPEGLGEQIRDDGTVDRELAKAAHAWFAPAYDLALAVPDGERSLSVPTWHYGHEPSTPFASHIGKLFQNSIREDGMLAIATHGVVYAPGQAGTLQEVFQDAAQNYYETYGDRSSPMVLLGTEYWTETFPVVPLLRALFRDRYDAIVHVTDDLDAAIAFIEEATPTASALEKCLPGATARPDEY